MKDFIGQEIRVGDVVAAISPRARAKEFIRGVVVSISATMIRVEYVLYPGCIRKTSRASAQVVVLPGNIHQSKRSLDNSGISCEAVIPASNNIPQQ